MTERTKYIQKRGFVEDIMLRSLQTLGFVSKQLLVATAMLRKKEFVLNMAPRENAAMKDAPTTYRKEEFALGMVR